MTVIRRAYGLADKTTEYVAAQRSGTDLERGHIVTQGHLYCISCGGPAVSLADFARLAGVTPRDVSAFLNHRTIREDKAQRIRAHLHHVDEVRR